MTVAFRDIETSDRRSLVLCGQPARIRHLVGTRVPPVGLLQLESAFTERYVVACVLAFYEQGSLQTLFLADCPATR